MLTISQASANRAATMVAEAARDMNFAAKDLLDAVEALGGLARAFVLLETAEPFDDEPLDHEELARFARGLREHDRARLVPPAWAGVQIGADSDSPPLALSEAEVRLNHGLLWRIPGYPSGAWLALAAAHLKVGLRIRVLAHACATSPEG